MKWYGLTGGIGTGKSTVAKIIREQGIPVVDADEIARQVLSPGSDGYNQVIDVFGEMVLDSSNQIDRKLLGAIVFGDREHLIQLEQILHPLIEKERFQRKGDLERAGHKVAFYDIPLLFEKKLDKEFDATIVVYCSPEEQLKRASQRDGVNIEVIQKRMENQLAIEEKISRADYAIDNNGGISLLKQNVLDLLSTL